MIYRDANTHEPVSSLHFESVLFDFKVLDNPPESGQKMLKVLLTDKDFVIKFTPPLKLHVVSPEKTH